MTANLIEALQEEMSLDRLARTGLFINIDLEDCVHTRDELIFLRAILDRALIDYFYPPDASYKDETGRDVFIKQEVVDWLKLDNPDFIETCQNAELSPEKVLKIFKTMELILTGDRGKFKKLGKREKKLV